MTTKERLKKLFFERGNDWILVTCMAIHDRVLYSETDIDRILDASDELVEEGFLEVKEISEEVKNPYKAENRNKAYRIRRPNV